MQVAGFIFIFLSYRHQQPKLCFYSRSIFAQDAQFDIFLSFFLNKNLCWNSFSEKYSHVVFHSSPLSGSLCSSKLCFLLSYGASHYDSIYFKCFVGDQKMRFYTFMLTGFGKTTSWNLQPRKCVSRLRWGRARFIIDNTTLNVFVDTLRCIDAH